MIYTGASLLDVVVLMGAIQGYISCSLVVFYPNIWRGNRYLGWLLLFLSSACLNIFLLETTAITNPIWGHINSLIPLIVIMPVGPLVFFYTRAWGRPDLIWQRRDYVHFLPTVLDLIPYVLALGNALTIYFGGFFLVGESSITAWHKYLDIPRWISISIYLSWSFRMISRQEQPHRRKAWPLPLLLAFGVFQVLWFCFLIPYLIPTFSTPLIATFGWYPVYFPIVGLVYWLGWQGFLKMKPPKVPNKQPILLDTSEQNKVLDLLDRVLQEERLYLAPKLTLADLAKATKVPTKTISFVLNQGRQTNFNDYVNTYRIEEVKKKLLDPTFAHYTISAIAFDCGFNSQATFQRAFKKIGGQSPSLFRKQGQKNSTQI